MGLGNVGDKYAGTRHNTGFSVIINLSDRYNIKMNKAECKAITGHGNIGGEKVILAQPVTYMNNSGEAVRALMDYYKCTTEDIIIIYDDTSLDVGRIRVRPKGSDGGHNGIKSVIKHLGTEVFDRVRVGIGDRGEWDMVDYVLGRFPKEELPLIRDAVDRAADAVEEIMKNGVDSAMNRFN